MRDSPCDALPLNAGGDFVTIHVWVKICPYAGHGFPTANFSSNPNVSLLTVRLHKCAFPVFLRFLEVKKQSKENITSEFQAFLAGSGGGKEDPKGIWIIILYFLNLKKRCIIQEV